MSSGGGELRYKLGLDGGGFMSVMKKAIGLVATYKIAMEGVNQIGKAMTLGSDLHALSLQMGESAGSVLVMKQAFEDAGLSVGNMETAVDLMRRSLTGMSEMGGRTEDAFRALGMDIQELRGMGAEQQFDTIGRAIAGLGSQADKTNAAMTIFGRSGAGMLRIFANPDAFKQARDSLGSMPAVMDKWAAKMNAVQTAWGRLKTSFTGAFAAALAPALPVLEEITARLNKIDFTRIGANIAAAFGAAWDMVQKIDLTDFAVGLANVTLTALSAAVREAFGLLLKGDFWKAVVKMALASLTGIGAMLMDVFAEISSLLAAGIYRAVDLAKDALAKIPGLDMFFKDHKSKSFTEHFESELRGTRQNFVKPAQDAAAELMVSAAKDFARATEGAGDAIAQAVAESSGGAYFRDLGQEFSEAFAVRLASIVKPVEAAAATFSNALTPVDEQAPGAASPALTPVDEQAPGAASPSSGISSDQWAKVGAFVSGGSANRNIEFARQTAASTKLMARTTQRMVALLERLEPAVL